MTRDYVDDRKPDTLQASFHSEFCYGPKTLPPQGDPVIPLTPIRTHTITNPASPGQAGMDKAFVGSVGRSVGGSPASCQLPAASFPLIQRTQETQ